MAEGGVGPAEERFNCSICLERFNKPRLLPCFHSFCTACIETYITTNSKQGKFECPLCRTTIAVPDNGAEGFQANFYIDTASETRDLKVHCDVCGLEEEAVHNCTDCEQNFCGRCSQTHTKIKMTRDHTLIELSVLDPKEKRKIIAKEFCREHTGQELLFVCKQCNVVLCMVCKLIGHESHATTDIKTEAKEVRTMLDSALRDQGAENFMLAHKENIMKAKALQKELENALKEELQTVELQVKRMHEAIDELSSSFKQKLQAQYAAGSRLLDGRIESMQTDLKSRAVLKDTAKLILDHGSDIEITRKGRRLAKDLRTVKRKVPGIRGNTKRLFVEGDLDITQLQTMLGKVKKEDTYEMVNAIEILHKGGIRLMKTFKVPGANEIMGLAPIGDNKAWISSFAGTTIWQVNTSGEVIKEFSLAHNIDAVAANSKKECTVSCCFKNTITHITNSGQVQTLLQDLSLHPHGLCYLQPKGELEELIFTCTTDQGLNGTDGFCSILRSSNKTQPVQTDTKAPFRVSIDPLSQRVCLADGGNQVVAVYSSANEPKLLRKYVNQDFTPCGVSFYGSNCVLAVNYDKDIRAISVTGPECNILLERKTFRSVAVDDNENLWVGLRGGAIEIYKIK